MSDTIYNLTDGVKATHVVAVLLGQEHDDFFLTIERVNGGNIEVIYHTSKKENPK